MRRSLLVAVIVSMAMAITVPLAAAQRPFPDVIDLPGGFFPEGIAVGTGHTVYTGSLVDGAIWMGDLRAGTGEVLVEGVAGRIAVGMAFDRRTDSLYVAGGPDGNAYRYDGATGALLDVVNLVPSGFVNDVIITKNAAYFTDSFAPQLYALPLSPNGAIAGAPATIPLTGDFQFAPGEFNANGIEVTPNGDTLMVVNSAFGKIYTVNPSSGIATTIDLGGAVVNGDGLVLIGRTLYAVEGSKNQITKMDLAADFASGTVTDALTNPAFDVPTTAARFGSSLYAVNAKFGTPPTPATPYEIVRVDR